MASAFLEISLALPEHFVLSAYFGLLQEHVGTNPERRARELSEEYNSAVTEMQQGLFGPSSDLPMSIRFSVSKSLPKARKVRSCAK